MQGTQALRWLCVWFNFWLFFLFLFLSQLKVIFFTNLCYYLLRFCFFYIFRLAFFLISLNLDTKKFMFWIRGVGGMARTFPKSRRASRKMPPCQVANTSTPKLTNPLHWRPTKTFFDLSIPFFFFLLFFPLYSQFLLKSIFLDVGGLLPICSFYNGRG